MRSFVPPRSHRRSLSVFPVSKRHLEEIIESAPEAISICSPDHRILRLNSEFTRLFGFTTAESAGKRLQEIIVPPDRYAETAWISECIETQAKITLETRRQRKDGSLVEVLLSTSPITATSLIKSAPRN